MRQAHARFRHVGVEELSGYQLARTHVNSIFIWYEKVLARVPNREDREASLSEPPNFFPEPSEVPFVGKDEPFLSTLSNASR